MFAQSRVKLRMSSLSGPFGLTESLRATNIDDVGDEDDEDDDEEEPRPRLECSTQTSPSRPARTVLRMEDRELTSESHTDGPWRRAGPGRQYGTLLRAEYELQNRARTALKAESSQKSRKPSFLAKVIRTPSRHEAQRKAEKEPPVRLS